MSDEHESFVKTPRQLITVVFLAFVVPIMIIILLVAYVTSVPRTGAGVSAMTPEAISSRIRPVAGFELRDANAPTVLRTGEAVIKGQCAACHETGAAGAPKIGDAAAWGPRIKQGLAALVNSALKGKNAMPPQGGGEYNDTEIARAVAAMANSAGAKFAEPQAAGASAGAAAPAGAADAGAAAAAPAAPASDAKPQAPAAEPAKKPELTSGS